MRRLILLLLIAGGVLVACGGGGGNSPVPAAGGGTGGGRTGQAKIAVLIPKNAAVTSGAKRAPHIISPGTAQLAFAVVSVNGASPAPSIPPLVITIASSQYCTTVASGTTCTVPVTVPIATSVVIDIATLDANGNVLGIGTTPAIDTTKATIPQQNVSLGGVPAKIALTATAHSDLDDGSVHQIVLGVTAIDASGNTIVPPGTYDAPISLSISNDPQGALSLSETSISAPGASGGTESVTLTYDSSKPLASQAIITAVSGTANNSVLFAPIFVSPLNLNALVAGGASGTVTVSEPGYSGTFSVGASSGFVTTSCAPATCTPTSVGGSVTITVAPVSAGTGYLQITDPNGGGGTIPVAVAQTSGGGGLVGGPYKIYEYATSSGGSNYGITVGPSGKTLWFVDRANATLGYVLNPGSCNGTTCSVGENTGLPGVQTPPVALQSIAAGPDGNLYLTDLGNYTSDLGSIFQVTCSDATGACSSGVQAASPGGMATPAPSDVKVAVDGNIYVASAYATSVPSTPPSPLDSAIISIGVSNFSAAPTTYVIRAAPDPSRPAFLAYDSLDQYMWFTDAGNGNIGFFPLGCNWNSTCTVTEQPSGSSVTTSPAVIRRRPSGSASGALPTPLAGIVAAPDGYLYVAVPAAHEIARVNPSTWAACSGASCTYDTIALPQANASPEQLTIGSDGNVWFTDTAGYIGMISLTACQTACQAYEYAVPTASGAPWGIVNGPDGNIWFTESASAKIGEVVLR